MTAPRPAPIRHRVEPRGVPEEKAARRLGETVERFRQLLPELVARGFPSADPTTGKYDMKKIDLWMDGPDPPAADDRAVDARKVVEARLDRLN